MTSVSKEKAMRALIKTAIESYATGFQTRHIKEADDPNGTINMKIHNVFIAALGPEIQYYSALARSLDSSLGNMLENLAINIAKLFFEVRQDVEGPLTSEQTLFIAELLEAYKSHVKKPSVKDYEFLRKKPKDKEIISKRHDSDYYLVDKNNNHHYLIELKIGGDLDNKKARSEKEAILEQYAILSNTLPDKAAITVYFATGYNRYGEGSPWEQERVKQFFAIEELLIGKDFWNFICQLPRGYEIVIDEYRKNATIIKNALDEIKKVYLK